jgi:hypothetical protein
MAATAAPPAAPASHCRAAVARTAAALAVTALLLAAWRPVQAEPPAQGFPPDVSASLAHDQEIYVATVRAKGGRSAAAPVWFAVIDNAVWFSTSPGSHKAQRVARGSPVYLSVHGAHGPFIKTKAEIVKDAAMAERLGEIYAQKYWMAWLGFFRPSRARVESGKIVLVRLTPGS